MNTLLKWWEWIDASLDGQKIPSRAIRILVQMEKIAGKATIKKLDSVYKE